MCKIPKNKKIEKKLKKGIDKRKEIWYNNKAVAKSGGDRSLKIEQQERSIQSLIEEIKKRTTKTRTIPL